MTVRRESYEIIERSSETIAAAVRQVFAKKSSYKTIRELERNRLFKVRIKPYWWLDSTSMTVILDEIKGYGTKVVVQTKSPILTFGDVFDCYRHYIQDFLKDLKESIDYAPD